MHESYWETCGLARQLFETRRYSAFGYGLDRDASMKLERLLRHDIDSSMPGEVAKLEREIRETTEWLGLLIEEEANRRITATQSLIPRLVHLLRGVRCPFCSGGMTDIGRDEIDNLLIFSCGYISCRCASRQPRADYVRAPDSLICKILDAYGSRAMPKEAYESILDCFTISSIKVGEKSVFRIVCVFVEQGQVRSAIVVDRQTLAEVDSTQSIVIVNDFEERANAARMQSFEARVAEGRYLKLYLRLDDNGMDWSTRQSDKLIFVDSQLVPDSVGTMTEGWYYCSLKKDRSDSPKRGTAHVVARIPTAHQPSVKPPAVSSFPEVIQRGVPRR